MKKQYIHTDTKTGEVLNQTTAEVMAAVSASNVALDQDDTEQLAKFITGVIHNDERMFIDNELVLL